MIRGNVLIGWSMAALTAVGASAQVTFNTTPDWESSDTRYSTGAAVVDLNRDGWQDLVIANGNDIARQPLAVYHNLGDGTFPAAPDWESNDIAYNGHLDVADVNADGWPDVAVAVLLNEGGPAAKLYLNNNGTLSSQPDWTSGEAARAFGVAFGDVNNDGRPDLAVATGWAYEPGYAATSTLHVNIEGQLEVAPSWQTDSQAHYMNLHWTDADNDGWQDLLFVASGTHTWLYRNLGGALETSPSWSTLDNQNQFSFMATSGDVDADGYRELFVTDNNQLTGGSGRFRRYDGLAAGDFTPMPSWWFFEGYGSAVALADVDADGDLDLTTGGWWERTRMFFNQAGLYASFSNWNSAGVSVVERIVFSDIDNSALRREVETFTPSDGPNLFYLSHQPIQEVLSVRVDDNEIGPAGYTFSREHGWVTVGVTTAEEIEVDYLFSHSLDMAISNWDNNKGNFVYYNQRLANHNCDGDGDVDLDDQACLHACLAGPGEPVSADSCGMFDADLDRDVYLVDAAEFQRAFSG